jgi:hypothetical protein
MERKLIITSMKVSLSSFLFVAQSRSRNKESIGFSENLLDATAGYDRSNRFLALLKEPQ